jgi:hypothetical protein
MTREASVDDWWIDTYFYPGPTTTQPLDDLIEMYRILGKQLSITLADFTRTMSALGASLIKEEQKRQPLPRNKNHGPRARTTFDHRGNRRY